MYAPFTTHFTINRRTQTNRSISTPTDTVLSSPQTLNIPLLLLANKQDSPSSLSVSEIRQDYEDWDQRRRESARRRFGEDENVEMERKRERIASLDVLGVSALDG
jgi:ADP-ribosylation factor related protein 1